MCEHALFETPHVENDGMGKLEVSRLSWEHEKFICYGPKFCMPDTQNLVRLRIYKTSTRTRVEKLIDPVVHNKNKINQSINHNNIKCLYNQLNAHAHFVFTAQPSVLGKVRACQCTLRRDTVSLYLALGVLAPRVSDAVDASSSPHSTDAETTWAQEPRL